MADPGRWQASIPYHTLEGHTAYMMRDASPARVASVANLKHFYSLQNKARPKGVSPYINKNNFTTAIYIMRKIIMTAALAALFCSSMTSCMGKFALTRNLYAWNEQVSNKFVNEVLFVAFWILPVYEVCGIADLLVLNSIEFWSGDNPMTASTQSIDTDHGRYLVERDGTGYDITLESTGEKYRLDFACETQTWSLQYDGKEMPLLTYVDDTHVSLPLPGGEWKTVELSESGVLAYRNAVAPAMLAGR